MPGKMARSDPRPSVRVTRGAGSGQHLAFVLQEGRENANVDAGLGFIWRISVKVHAAPVGTPWLWTLAFGHHEDRWPTHGYEPTREAAMAAFAKSWRRGQPGVAPAVIGPRLLRLWARINFASGQE